MSKLSRISKKWGWLIGIVCSLVIAISVYALMIEDGKGTGNRAQVGSDSFLKVKAVTETLERHMSHEYSRSYILNSGCSGPATLTSTAAGGYILYIKNNSATQTLVVENVVITSNTAGVVMAVMKNPTLGTISNHNVSPPINLDFESGKTADATAYTWNETGNGMGGITSGSTLFTCVAAVGPHLHEIGGAINLSTGNSLGIQVFGAGEVSVGTRIYYIESS